MQTVDIIISGGGMVGAVAANALSAAGFEVALIEANEQTTFAEDSPRSLRVSAIAQKHLDQLSVLGIDDFLYKSRIGPYRHMSVWDNGSLGELDFSAEGNTDLGAIIENIHVVYAAQQRLAQLPKVHTFYQNKIIDFKQTERKVVVQLIEGDELQASLLVACEGARSPLREEAGIQIKQKNYQQRAMVAYLQVENAPKQTALQAFNLSGPVALLPFGDNLFSLVWSCDETSVDNWLEADETTFINGLKAHLRRDFGQIKLLSKRAAFPLQQMYAEETVKQRLLLVGDAAHVVHPLAGQGVNLGLSDVVELVQQLSEVNIKDFTGLNRALRRYQRRRRSEVIKTSELMSFLHRLYQIEQPTLSWLRSTGMLTLNRLPLLKNWLLQQAGS